MTDRENEVKLAAIRGINSFARMALSEGTLDILLSDLSPVVASKDVEAKSMNNQLCRSSIDIYSRSTCSNNFRTARVQQEITRL